MFPQYIKKQIALTNFWKQEICFRQKIARLLKKNPGPNFQWFKNIFPMIWGINFNLYLLFTVS
jgi:hypothetical protein